MTKRLYKIEKLLVLLTVFVTVFACAVCGFTAAPALADNSYGGKTAESLWYFGESYLNLSALKNEVSTWDLSGVSKDNPVVIAVVDTGLNYNHELFTSTNTVLKNSSGTVRGYNSYFGAKGSTSTSELGSVGDVTDNSHGTAVAGIMAMLIYELGLSDYIKLYPIKASNSGTPQSSSTSASYYRSFSLESVKAALEWVQSTKDTIGVDVVNLSFTVYDETWDSTLSKLLTDLSDDAVIVAAAGNGDNDEAPNGYSTAAKTSDTDTLHKKGYPASSEGVLSVMGYKAGGAKSTMSNYGNYDLIAPGTDIYTASGKTNAYQTIGGTSMAAAFASVTAALIKLKNAADVAGGNADEVSAPVIAKHIRTGCTSSISYTDAEATYNLPKLDVLETVTSDIGETYTDVKGMRIADEGVFTDGSVTYDIDKVKSIELTAQLLPFGDTDPLQDEYINWYLIKTGTRFKTDGDGNETDETETYEVSSTLLSSGKKLSYTPNAGGNYILRAVYLNGGTTYSAERAFTVRYLDYTAYANGVKVILASELNQSAQNNAATVFTGDTVVLTATYLSYFDPSEEIKWYVNGEYAASGLTFNFKSKKVGEYVISVSYGEYGTVNKTFTVVTESSIARPESIISISIIGAAALIAVIAVTVAAVKKKKRAA